MAQLRRELSAFGYIRDNKIESLISNIIPNEIPLLIAVFYPIFIDFEGNSFNLTMDEKKFITEWLEEVLLDDTTQNNVLSSSLVYDANQHGYQGSIYHEKCNKEINKFTIIESIHQHVFGGFTSVEIPPSPCGYSGAFFNDPKSFLFLIRSKFKDHQPKMYKVGDDIGENALYVDSDYGPIFGETEIALLLNNKNEKGSHFVYHRGSTYPGIKGNTLCGGDTFEEEDNMFQFIAKNIQTFTIHLN